MNVWRERLERWFRPLAERSPLSPNQITLLALVLNLAAATALALARHETHLFLLAPLLLAIAGIFDALDGIVARLRSMSTRYGDFLDHLCDRISDAALLAGYLLGASVRPSLGYPALVAVVLTGYVGTQIEATWRRRDYSGVGRGEYVLALFAIPIFSWILARLDLLTHRVGGLTPPEWMIALVLLTAIWTIAGRAAGARAHDEGDPE